MELHFKFLDFFYLIGKNLEFFTKSWIFFTCRKSVHCLRLIGLPFDIVSACIVIPAKRLWSYRPDKRT